MVGPEPAEGGCEGNNYSRIFRRVDMLEQILVCIFSLGGIAAVLFVLLLLWAVRWVMRGR